MSHLQKVIGQGYQELEELGEGKLRKVELTQKTL